MGQGLGRLRSSAEAKRLQAIEAEAQRLAQEKTRLEERAREELAGLADLLEIARLKDLQFQGTPTFVLPATRS